MQDVTDTIHPADVHSIDDAPTVEYRDLNADQIAEEFARRADDLRRAIEGYERAKAVSQATLEATVCV